MMKSPHVITLKERFTRQGGKRNHSTPHSRTRCGRRAAPLVTALVPLIHLCNNQRFQTEPGAVTFHLDYTGSVLQNAGKSWV